ncbi:unnamed protein product, partial [Effrenium voratum]
MDRGREHWLRHFCEADAEQRQLLQWLLEEGLSRPAGFQARIDHSQRLKTLGNDWYGRDDYRRALHCNLGALHSVDFTPQEQLDMDDGQRLAVANMLLPIVSNLAQVFLKRGDWRNAIKAATLGLRHLGKTSLEDANKFEAKLRFRRALARGEPGPERDLGRALDDLREAARIMPTSADIRGCLENCKGLLRKEHKLQAEAAGTAGQDDPDAPDALDGESDGCGGAGAELREEGQLSNAQEKFAEHVGRCLGKLRRYWRNTRLTFLRTARKLLSLAGFSWAWRSDET